MKRVPTDAHDSNLAKRRKHGPVKPRTKASVIPTGDRVLLADMGHSSITQLIGKLEILLFEEIMEQTTEQQVAIVLLTGLPRGQTNTDDMERQLPQFAFEEQTTDGSTMLAAWHKDIWTKVSVETLVLTGVPQETVTYGKRHYSRSSTERNALLLTLQRISACGVPSLAEKHTIKILLTKFHYGTQKSGHAFDAHSRAAAWQKMLETVQSHNKILIAGSFGMMNETQLAQRLKECACSLNPHIILSEDKAITCLALGLTPSACANHDTRQLVIMDFSGSKKSTDTVKPRVEPAATGKAGAKKSKSASSKPDGPAPSREPLVLRSHHDCLLRALTQANEDGEHLVQLIFGPTRKHWWAPDGTLMMEATTHKQCKHKLEFALKLLHGARKEAMSKSRATTDTLSQSQMATAISWLHDVFRECYLKKPYLGDALDAWDEGCEMTRDEKTRIKHDFRSSFRAFLREVAGDASLAYAIVRHGYESPKAITGIVREIFTAREKARAKRQENPDLVTRKSHPHLAEAATDARRSYARGHRIAMDIEHKRWRYEDLNQEQMEMHRRYHSGQLEREMIAANKAFGHGWGVPSSLSIEQMASFE